MLKNLNWSILQIYTSSTTHGITSTVLTCDTERERDPMWCSPAHSAFTLYTALFCLTQRFYTLRSVTRV